MKPRRLLALAVVLLLVGCSSSQTEGATSPRNQALYVTMRDGVRIAIDVWLPANLEAGERIPTVMRATRYWRASDIVSDKVEDQSNYSEAGRFNNAGYALVVVDSRGSGASFGWRPYELAEDEVKDFGEVVDWIVGQSWSNGRVGAWGVSYSGNTAEMLAVNRHPAVKAIAPLFNDFDNFGHLVFPGGVLCVGFLKDWSDAVHEMDTNDVCALRGVTAQECAALKQRVRGVKPTDEDTDGQLLAAAVREHQQNTRPYEAALDYDFRDDPFGLAGHTDVGYKRSPAGFLPEIEESGVAMLIRVGWLDAGTVNGALGRFTTINNPQSVFIGPWDHGAGNNADPFLDPDTPVEPSRDEQFDRMLEFFDVHLKHSESSEKLAGEPDSDKPVRGAVESQISYYTLGAGEWTTTKVWPPEGFTRQQWYFSGDGGLSTEVPTGYASHDRYTVDYEATTGVRNRWYTNGGAGDVIYPDRAEEDEKLLTYTSEPMARDIEITGHPVVTLFVASTHSDGAFIVYFEDVAPDGRVTYITEGQLRGIMRRVSDEPPRYNKYGPHHSQMRADAMPLVPGEIAELTFELWATSVLIKQGHRIRIAVAGADKDTFYRYPKEGGTPTITVNRNRMYPSHVDLPVRER